MRLLMKSTIIYIDGVGLVLFERSLRAKYLNISIKPIHGIRVGIPIGISIKKAEEFVYAKIPWIRKHLKKIELQSKKQKPHSTTIDREIAKKTLVSRLVQLAAKHGFQYKKVFIKTQKTRWGSCSSKNNINLNMKLTLLPAELMDYVIVHELVHTRIKNHSKEFWTELDRFVNNARELDRKLKNWSIELF